METWPYDLAPFCTYCGFVLERRKTDRVKLDIEVQRNRIHKQGDSHADNGDTDK